MTEEHHIHDHGVITDAVADHPPDGRARTAGVKATPMTADSGRKPIGKMLLAVGAIVVAGLAITLVVIRAQAPARESGPPSADGIVPPVSAVRDATPPPADVQPAPRAPADPPAAPVQPKKPRGPMGVVTVPSAGLRSAPSLDARMTKTVVKERERVAILQRKASSSGPDWIQVETSSGRSGWVWASVVKQRKESVQ